MFLMNRRSQLLSSTLACIAVMAPVLAQAVSEDFAARYLLSDQGSGRATAYSEANKIVTFNGKTHVAWLDSTEEGFQVPIRSLDHATGTWSQAYVIDGAEDNHGGPALSVDSKGYLHVVYYAHNDPMRYRRSLRPNDASAWTDYVAVGEKATYPTLVCGPEDTLYLTCRNSSKTEPWTCRLYVKPVNKPWEAGRSLLIADEPGYAQFMDAMAWSPDRKTLHLSCWFYGGKPGIGPTIGYLQSNDGAETWARLDGTPVTLPAREATVSQVSRMGKGNKEGLRGSRLAVAPDGRPFILWSDYNPRPQRGWLSYPDADGTWQHIPLNPALPAPFADWGLLTPGGVTFNEDGKLFVVLGLVKPKNPAHQATHLHPALDIAIFRSTDMGQSFTGEVLPNPDPKKNRWLPNLEAPTGHNRIQGAPGLIYTEGERGSSTDDILSNRVHWLRL